MDRIKTRNLEGLVLTLLGSIFFMLRVFSNESRLTHSVDFKGVYGGTRFDRRCTERLDGHYPV
jgi:hypothetical protein